MREVRELLIAISGATGAIYADRLLRAAVNVVPAVGLVITPQGAEIAAHELGWAVDFDTLRIAGPPAEVLADVRLYHPNDLSSRYASGSSAPDAMIVIPCSVNLAGSVAAGLAHTMVSRTAAICLKERRPLVLAIRESPLSLIDLRNLVTLAEAGAIIMPASPSFYSAPRTVEELADFFAVRVLDQIGVSLEHPGRWAG